MVEAVSEFLLASRCALAVAHHAQRPRIRGPQRAWLLACKRPLQNVVLYRHLVFHASGRWQSQLPGTVFPPRHFVQLADYVFRISEGGPPLPTRPPQQQQGWLSRFIRLLTLGPHVLPVPPSLMASADGRTVGRILEAVRSLHRVSVRNRRLSISKAHRASCSCERLVRYHHYRETCIAVPKNNIVQLCTLAHRAQPPEQYRYWDGGSNVPALVGTLWRL